MHAENSFFEATVGLSLLLHKFLSLIWVHQDQSLLSWFAWNWREDRLTFSSIFLSKTSRTMDVPILTSLLPKIPIVFFRLCTVSPSRGFLVLMKGCIWKESRQAHSVCLSKFSQHRCCKTEATPSQTRTKLHRDSRNPLPENGLLSWSFREACTRDFHRNCRLCHLKKSNWVLPVRSLQSWCGRRCQQEYFTV